MRISIFGLGYVGCVSAGCLSENGHQVNGVDVNNHKVDLINQGSPTIVEKDIDSLIKKNWHEGRITATTDSAEAVSKSEIALICVGTPNLPSGQLNLEFVFNTAQQIGEAIVSKKEFFTIAIRSTVFPGTNEKFATIVEQVSGKKRNVDFAVISNPEFLREGSAVEDYYHPALTVLGADNDRAFALMESLYHEIKAPVVRTDIRVAELIKYVSNAFHALKISFANEVGNISKALGIDAFRVMELFTMDTRLNISPACKFWMTIPCKSRSTRPSRISS
ncbi:MAG: nucleotide sugar dehydrogenase [Desulfobacterales bacterium]|nr:nucleotide sugar dehydrogenase [Desulfobacterales bacterium]